MVPFLTVSRDLARQPASPFDRGPNERALRLLIDWNGIRAGEARQLLWELAEGSLFDAVSVSDLLSNASFQSHDGADVLVSNAPDFGFVSLGRSEDLRREAEDFAEIGSIEYEKALLNARLAAYSCDTFDALVSESPLFAARTRAGINVLTAEQALPVLGLYLRSRDDYRWMGHPHAQNMSEGFFRQLTRSLLPGLDVLVGAALANRRGGLGVDVTELAASFVAQVARCLRARDHLQLLARSSSSPDSAPDLAMFFDIALVYLSGAFDSLARLTATAHAIDNALGRERQKWQNLQFIKALRHSHPNSAQVVGVATDAEVKRLHGLLRDLRNTVHGPVLQPTLITGSGHARFVMRAPQEQVETLEQRLSGWPDTPPIRWGCEFHRLGPPLPGTSMRSGRPSDPVAEIWIEPAVCLERVLAMSFNALEALLEAVDWSRLKGAHDGFMPIGDSQPVDSNLRTRILLLGGVG